VSIYCDLSVPPSLCTTWSEGNEFNKIWDFKSFLKLPTNILMNYVVQDLLEHPVFIDLVKNIPAFIEPQYPSPCSHDPTTEPCSESVESRSYFHIIFL
jgi:hypothetical protein